MDLAEGDLRVEAYLPVTGVGGGDDPVPTARITHLPTGTVSVHQGEKSFLRNTEAALRALRAALGASPTRAEVILFKPSGKYYTTEHWRIPDEVPRLGAPPGRPSMRPPIGPYDMEHSPDFRRISGGAVLVVSQEPWGYPHLFPGVGR